MSDTFVTLYFPCSVTGEPDANVLQIFCNENEVSWVELNGEDIVEKFCNEDDA